MGSNPLNLVLRFLLETAALVVISYGAFSQHSGTWHSRLVIGLFRSPSKWAPFDIASDQQRRLMNYSRLMRLGRE